MTHEDDVRVWLKKADNDLRNITNNLRPGTPDEDIPWDTICFHAQQAAEKSLKATLVSAGIFPPRTHDLIALLKSCVDVDVAFLVLQNDCIALTQYGIAPRYPDDMLDPTASDGREMFAAAKRVREVVRRVIRG